MLYMVTMRVLDNDDNVHTYAKIGKTHDWLKRVVMYVTHNPAAQVVGFHEGYTKAEKKAHARLLKSFGCTKVVRYGITTEWVELPKNTTIQEIAKRMKYEL